MAVHLWQNRRQLQRGAETGKVPRPVPSLRSTGSYYAALVSHGPEAAAVIQLSLGDLDEPPNGPGVAPGHMYFRGSHVTRHESPLSMGDRSEAMGETLGSEVSSTNFQLDDDEQESRSGLPSILELLGKEGPPSPNATVSEGSALHGLAQKAAEIQRLPSPVKSGRRSGGASWLTHSDEYALALSKVGLD